MKTFMLALFSFLSFNLFAQVNCGLDQVGSDPLGVLEALDNIDFFSETSCEPLVLKCNFVFLRREDGTGSMQESLIPWMITSMNNRIGEVKDEANCENNPEYPYDANIRFDVDIHYINDGDAYDWYGASVALPGYGKTSFCPGTLISQGNWPSLLDDVITPFNNTHVDEFNFFFVENDTHLSFMENAVENNIPLTQPWNDPEMHDIFGGCSMTANDYHSTAPRFIVIADRWTEYYKRLHHGEVYFPTESGNGVSNQTLANWSYWENPTLFNHELGHTIMDQGHTCGCQNLMIGAGCNPDWIPNRNHLSEFQLDKLHKTLSTTHLHRYVDCNQLTADNCNLYVRADEEIKQPMSIFGDLIIEAGVTLTIIDEVFLAPESRIILEEGAQLIVDNGYLGSECGTTWKGIRVTGGHPVADVMIINNSVVENTSKAAVSMKPPLPWPDMLSHGNGVLIAENSTFNNVKRIVELISFTPQINDSRIENCIQNGGKYAVTNWNGLEVKILDNEFWGLTREGIVTDGGSFELTGNRIQSDRNDVLFVNASSGIGSLINHNEFLGTSTGIRSNGASLGQNDIQQNDFLLPQFGIFMDGDNNFWAEKNDMFGDFGSSCFDNGNHSNVLSQNLIESSLNGIVTSGFNDDLVFYENCFDTGIGDIFLNGSVSPIVSGDQNDPKSPANNCFTHQGQTGAVTTDFSGSYDPFVYVEPNDLVVDCRDVLNGAGIEIWNYETPMSPCGEAGSGSGGTWVKPVNPCNPPKSVQGSIDAINALIALIQNIQSSTILTDEQKELYVAAYEKCLQRAKGQLLDLHAKNKDYAEVRNCLVGDHSEKAFVAVFSSYLAERDFTAARNMLVGATHGGTDFANFKETQLLNIERLEEGPDFEPKASQLADLFSRASTSAPLAGYSKALYYIFTGDVVSSTIPDRKGGTKSLINSSLEIEESSQWKVYPNPFKNQLFINVEGTLVSENTEIKIIDINGREIARYQNVQDGITLNTENWENGIYIVQIIKDNVLIDVDRVSHLK